MAKYIQNVHIAAVKCKLEEKGGQLVAGRLPSRDIIFRPYSSDRRDGRQGETGYTEVSDADYAALCEQSKLFTHSIENKLLVVHDELPADAQTPYDMLQAARREIAALTNEIAELKAQGSGKGADKATKKALEDAQTKIEALELSKQATDTAYLALEALVAAIDPAVVEAAKAALVAKADNGPKF